MSLIVRIINLPATIRGLTVPDEDGNYNVYLNVNLSYEAQRRTFEHEIEHIRKKHFHSDKPVRAIERNMAY